MFQQDLNWRPMGLFHTILPPHFIGRLTPSRHDVERHIYQEKQAAQRVESARRAAEPEHHQPSLGCPVEGGPSSGWRRLASAHRPLRDW